MDILSRGYLSSAVDRQSNMIQHSTMINEIRIKIQCKSQIETDKKVQVGKGQEKAQSEKRIPTPKTEAGKN